MTTITTLGVSKGQCIMVNSVRMQLFTKTKVGVPVQTGHDSVQANKDIFVRLEILDVRITPAICTTMYT